MEPQVTKQPKVGRPLRSGTLSARSSSTKASSPAVSRLRTAKRSAKAPPKQRVAAKSGDDAEPADSEALALAGLANASPAMKTRANEEVQAWGAEFLARRAAEFAAREADADQRLEEFFRVFPERRAQLRDSQTAAVRFALASGGKALVASEMGTGKSLIALVLAQIHAEDWPVLIVAPAVVTGNWRNEVVKWLPHLANEVQLVTRGKDRLNPRKLIFIMSYELLVRNEHFTRCPDGAPYKVIIVDEAHNIKNPLAQRTQAVLPLCQNATCSVLLTGTPVMNRASEVWTLLAAMESGRGIPPFTKFCQRYCQVRTLKSGQVRVDGAKHKEELHELLSSVMVRFRKAEVLPDLAGKRRIWKLIDPKELGDVGKRCGAKILPLLKRVKDFENVMSQVFTITAEAKTAYVCNYVEEMLAQSGKLVVFAHHMNMMNKVEKRLRECLKANAQRLIRIDGSVPAPTRTELVASFQQEDDVRVALVSITACGQGISLTAASRVVFAELFWVPGRLLQAEDRVHRPGQERDVEIHYCVVDGRPFLDKAIQRKLLEKEKLTGSIVEGRLEESCFDIHTGADAEAGKKRGRGRGSKASL